VIHRSTQLCACCNVIAYCQRYGGECLLPSKQVQSTALLHISKHKSLFCKQLVSSGRCGPESANAMRMQASNSVLLKICAGVCLFIDTPPNQHCCIIQCVRSRFVSCWCHLEAMIQWGPMLCAYKQTRVLSLVYGQRYVLGCVAILIHLKISTVACLNIVLILRVH